MRVGKVTTLIKQKILTISQTLMSNKEIGEVFKLHENTVRKIISSHGIKRTSENWYYYPHNDFVGYPAINSGEHNEQKQKLSYKTFLKDYVQRHPEEKHTKTLAKPFII